MCIFGVTVCSDSFSCGSALKEFWSGIPWRHCCLSVSAALLAFVFVVIFRFLLGVTTFQLSLWCDRSMLVLFLTSFISVISISNSLVSVQSCSSPVCCVGFAEFPPLFITYVSPLFSSLIGGTCIACRTCGGTTSHVRSARLLG
jgi:hypothetical protein